MKNLIPAYLLLFMLFTIAPAKAQNRGKVLSGNQIIVFDPTTGTFEIQNVNDPGGEVGDSVEVSTERRSLSVARTSNVTSQLTTSLRSGSGTGEILSMDGDRSLSGQIMYKRGDSFALIDYKKQRLSADLGVGSCVSFTIKRDKAVGLAEAPCE